MIRRVMVIEDDTDAAFMLKYILLKAGFEVESLTGGHSILDRRFIPPDLFMLDNGLPTINGVALRKYLKLQHDLKHIPVVLISGDEKVDARSDAHEPMHLLKSQLPMENS